MNDFAVVRTREIFRVRANVGLARAAETLAAALRARGLRADASSNAEGRARVHIEGAGLVAREFGTMHHAASPIVTPIVRAHRREIAREIAAAITSRS